MGKTIPKRLIGSYTQGQDGPLLFFIGGIHGNEPAGVIAMERLFEELNQLNIPFKGKVVGVRGNCRGLAQDKRFIDRDMNRIWTQEHIEYVKNAPEEELNVESLEQKELLVYLEAAQEEGRKVYLFDLHTTSGAGGVFSVVEEEDEVIRLAAALYAPVVLKLHDNLAATTLLYMEDQKITGFAFEGGQHKEEYSAVRHHAAAWILLESLGCVNATDYPKLQEYHQVLKKTAEELPDYVEVTYRHDIEGLHDKFKMRPGYSNFQEVTAGIELADDKDGVILCPSDGLLLMPLYQPQGEDGFFVIKEIANPLLKKANKTDAIHA